MFDSQNGGELMSLDGGKGIRGMVTVGLFVGLVVLIVHILLCWLLYSVIGIGWTPLEAFFCCVILGIVVALNYSELTDYEWAGSVAIAVIVATGIPFALETGGALGDFLLSYVINLTISLVACAVHLYIKNRFL